MAVVVLFTLQKILNLYEVFITLMLMSVSLSVGLLYCRPPTAQSVRMSSALCTSGVAARRPLVSPSTDHRRSLFLCAATYLVSLNLPPLFASLSKCKFSLHSFIPAD